MISAGRSHTLALKLDGTVWAWGENTYGQLGLGDGAGTNNRGTPQQITFFANNGINIVSVAAGRFHSMALSDTGDVYVWGRNDSGQIGKGTKVASGAGSKYTTPQLVTTYKVWSGNTVGSPIFVDASSDPYERPRIRAIAAGNNHCIALSEPVGTLLGGRPPKGAASGIELLESGPYQYVFAWGENANGQLATSDLADKTYPTSGKLTLDRYRYKITSTGEEVVEELEMLDIAGGAIHSVGTLRRVDQDGVEYRGIGAGGNDLGQIDAWDGWIGTNFTEFTSILSLGIQFPFTSYAGNKYSFFFGEKGIYNSVPEAGRPLSGNGQNKNGEIGAGYFNQRWGSTPTYTEDQPYQRYDGTYGLYDLRQFSTGHSHSLARTHGGQVYVWGNNRLVIGGVDTAIHALGLGGQTGGGQDHNKPRLNPHSLLVDIAYVAAGGYSSFAVKKSGAVYSWGYNDHGQLGVSGVQTQNVPTRLAGDFNLWNDADADGLPDEWEQHYFSGMTQTASDDPDGDGILNSQEWERRLNPASKDSDLDFLPDNYELASDYLLAHVADDLEADYDGDGLSNVDEYVYGADLFKKDTDGDGVEDGAEVAGGSNPVDPADLGQPSSAGMIEIEITIGDSRNAVGSYAPTHSGDEGYRIVVRDKSSGAVAATVQAAAYGKLTTRTIKVPQGPEYTLSVERFASAYTQSSSYINYYYCNVIVKSGAQAYTQSIPSDFLGPCQLLQEGVFIELNTL